MGGLGEQLRQQGLTAGSPAPAAPAVKTKAAAPRRRRAAYAYLCDACAHLASRHGLAEDGDLRAGPYQCRDCSCEIAQDAPVTAMSKRQYEAWAEAHPDLTWDGGR